jgi:hypothetical protein
MNPFDPTPPQWTHTATHASRFCCPSCAEGTLNAEQVWINRRSPVYTETQQRKWQEFYHCGCGQAWWAWSSDRPPTTLRTQQDER